MVFGNRFLRERLRRKRKVFFILIVLGKPDKGFSFGVSKIRFFVKKLEVRSRKTEECKIVPVV